MAEVNEIKVLERDIELLTRVPNMTIAAITRAWIGIEDKHREYAPGENYPPPSDELFVPLQERISERIEVGTYPLELIANAVRGRFLGGRRLRDPIFTETTLDYHLALLHHYPYRSRILQKARNMKGEKEAKAIRKFADLLQNFEHDKKYETQRKNLIDKKKYVQMFIPEKYQDNAAVLFFLARRKRGQRLVKKIARRAIECEMDWEELHQKLENDLEFSDRLWRFFDEQEDDFTHARFIEAFMNETYIDDTMGLKIVCRTKADAERVMNYIANGTKKNSTKKWGIEITGQVENHYKDPKKGNLYQIKLEPKPRVLPVAIEIATLDIESHMADEIYGKKAHALREHRQERWKDTLPADKRKEYDAWIERGLKHFEGIPSRPIIKNIGHMRG